MGPGLDRSYLYTADDERLAVIDDQIGGVETWRVRDLEGRILRE